MKKNGCSNGVIEHCINVTKVALRIANVFKAKGYKVDVKLVEAGALLHDIGRGQTHGIEHGVVGGQTARKLGMPMELAHIIERHVGAGLTVDEARRNNLPRGSYIPETLEEKIVCYADKLIEGAHEVGIDSTIENFAEELGVDHPAIKRLKDLHAEMTAVINEKV
jgi:uncharacterized protein